MDFVCKLQNLSLTQLAHNILQVIAQTYSIFAFFITFTYLYLVVILF